VVPIRTTCSRRRCASGQRVVCVDASPNRLASDRKLLVAGRIYIICAIDVAPSCKWPWCGVHLEGIRHLYLDGKIEWAFHPGHFRPVTERPTDITIFKELAASTMADALPLSVRRADSRGAAGRRLFRGTAAVAARRSEGGS
jgi:hypothetical protein